MISKKIWDSTIDGEQIILYTLTNKSGAKVQVTNIGAAIVSAVVPDSSGRMQDVVLGYPDGTSYIGDGPAMGKVPGRYANRIARGKFTLDGVQYELPINNGVNHLHGGSEGYCNRIWDSRVKENSVVFWINDEDGSCGYPGNLDAYAQYTWTDDNRLIIDLSATTDKATIINLTNHAYFNLMGEGAGDILDHELKLYASHYLPTDDTLIPTGEIAPVEGTPMDFTKTKTIGKDIGIDFPSLVYGKGYDSCWVIDNWKKDELKLVAELSEATTGRTLNVYTTQPGIQLYSGNWLYGSLLGKGGKDYHDYQGVALECQAFPDAPNHPNFPSTVLRPGEEYKEQIIFEFGVK